MRGATRWKCEHIFFTYYFNPRPSCEERPPCICSFIHCFLYFNPRPSCEERRFCVFIITYNIISTHAPHARSDSTNCFDIINVYISTHAPHARSDSYDFSIVYITFISTHAPHARSDDRGSAHGGNSSISTHAPHARSDSNENQKNNYHFLFFIYSSDFQLSIWAALLNNGISDW